jgi:hypothetical protein
MQQAEFEVDENGQALGSVRLLAHVERRPSSGHTDRESV